MSGQLLYSLEDAARQLGGVSTRTVRRLIDRGDLAACRVGRRLMVVADSVESYVDDAMSPAHNCNRAVKDVREVSTCRRSVKRGTGMVSIGGKTRRTGGPVSPMQAAKELAAVLELPTVGKPRQS